MKRLFTLLLILSSLAGYSNPILNFNRAHNIKMEEQVVQGEEIVVKSNKDKSVAINELSVIGRNTYINYALCLFHRIGLNSKHYKSILNEFLKT